MQFMCTKFVDYYS